MAERFGGKHSPGGDPRAPGGKGGPYEGRRRKRGAGRINLLFFAPVPLVFTGFQSDATGLALNLVAFAILILAAWLTREGVEAQEAYDARSVARRPAIPRKIFASVLTGIGLFVGGLIPGQGLGDPLIYAGLGFALHLLAFGPDPLRNKGMEGLTRAESSRVARAVDQGEKYLADMAVAAGRLNDARLAGRVARFAETARAMFRRVEADPRDLTASRKYLGVYLMGARDATVKFADLFVNSRDAQARADYEALLDDLERNFEAQSRHLLENDRTDLDIEIEVLRERLAREGVRAG